MTEGRRAQAVSRWGLRAPQRWGWWPRLPHVEGSFCILLLSQQREVTGSPGKQAGWGRMG